MYRIKTFKSIEDVPYAFWQIEDHNFCSLYRTKQWLSNSQWRLGGEQLYVGAYCENAAVALFPLILFDTNTDYPRFEPSSILAQAGLHYFGRVALCASIFGNGRAFRMLAQKDFPLEPLVDLLKDLLRKNYACSYLLFIYHTAYDDPFLSLRQGKQITSDQVGALRLDSFENWDAYIQSLRKKPRQNYLQEERRAENGGVVVRRERINSFDLTLLENLGVNVYHKYGISVPAGRVSSFVEYIGKAFPHSSGLIVAMQNELLLSYVVYIIHGNTLYLKMHGRDYEHDHYQTYFLVAYHAPIKFAIEQHLSFVEYGSGSEQAKQRRHVEMIPTFGYIFELSSQKDALSTNKSEVPGEGNR